MLENLLDQESSHQVDRSLNPSEAIESFDISHLTIEDDEPVDNFQSEVQQRLLVEPLYSSAALPMPFLAAANVGLFYQFKEDPIVPDVMVSLNVQRADDFSEKRNRSYFAWEFGKVPDLCLEIVSNQEGDELIVSRKSQGKGRSRSKFDLYAQIGVGYYVVFDPLKQIQTSGEMDGALLRVWAINGQGYAEITPVQGLVQAGDWVWLPNLGIGLCLWEGMFEEEVSRLWARWCDRQGRPINTGAEGQRQAREEADRQRGRADRQTEEADRQREEADRQREEAVRQKERADRLAEQLRALGIEAE
jgi:Uma2 family endonuclease